MLSPQNNSTSGCGASIIAIIRPTPVSNLTTTNKVYTAVNIDDNAQYFATPINNNHSAIELRDINPTMAQVHPQFNLRQRQ